MTPGCGPGARRARRLADRLDRSAELVGSGPLAAAAADLVVAAERALGEGPWSVTDKGWFPDGLDAHEYVHVAPYAWPDPGNPGGPWVIRDGRVNPAAAAMAADGDTLAELARCVRTLALAAAVAGDPAYRLRAVELVVAFFVDPATAMRPSLTHAVHVPGQREPASWGLARLQPLLDVVDAVALLRMADPSASAGFDDWCARFASWLAGSDLLRAELARANNHSTVAASLVLGLAVHLDDPSVPQLAGTAERVVAEQVAPDGSQPAERARPRSLYYCGYNLAAMLRLRDLLAGLGRTEVDVTLRRALDRHLPYLVEPRSWPDPGPVPSDVGRHGDVLVRAVAAYPGSAAYRDALDRSPLTPDPTDPIWIELGLDPGAARRAPHLDRSRT